ncbi:MAG: tetratricopeptide repeat protein [Candidatus Kapaibacteriales bacterium]
MNTNIFNTRDYFGLSIVMPFLLLLTFELIGFERDDPYSLFAKGQTAFFNKQYRRAIPYFSHALKLGDTSFLPYYFRGLSYLYLNQFDSAVVDLEKAAEKNNHLPDIFNNLGLAYQFNGDLKLSLDSYSQAIMLDSNFAEAYSNRASVYNQIGEIEAALLDLEKAIKLKPKNPFNYYERGRAYYKLKRYKDAIVNFDKAIKLGLNNSKVYYSRGNAYFKNENYKMAIKDYTKCLELDSLDPDALNNRAVAYDKIGDSAKANYDRRRLAKLVGNENLFVSFEEIKFFEHTDSAKHFSLQIPSNWHIWEKKSIEDYEIIISPEKIYNDSSFYNVGVKLVYNSRMEKNYGISSPAEILDFWRGSVEKNSSEFEFYQVVRQKIFTRGNYTGILYETVIQFNKNTPLYRFYELGLAKEGILTFGYFQAPEVQFEHLRKIFDKILETIVILK